MSMPNENLRRDISIARSELKNIRQEAIRIKAQFLSEVKEIKKLLCEPYHQNAKEIILKDEIVGSCNMIPIGVISSCFKSKNGIPRQATLCQSVKATLEINKNFFTNPEHSLIGLEKFLYIWVLFVFHKNNPDVSVKAKVHPPRLDGVSVGVFSTRSPHRPCAIGLSLVKLDKIKGNKLFLSGVDILDGTPVLDIKPYIQFYDTPNLYSELNSNECMKNILTEDIKNSTETSFESDINYSKENEISESNSNTRTHLTEKLNEFKNNATKDSIVRKLNCCCKNEVVEFCKECSTNVAMAHMQNLLSLPLNSLKVIFTSRAEEDIEKFHLANHSIYCDYCLDFMSGFLEAKQAIVEILQNDPRSVYRRNKCTDKLYYFEVDKMHITCWFDGIIAEVLRIKPRSQVSNVSE